MPIEVTRRHNMSTFYIFFDFAQACAFPDFDGKGHESIQPAFAIYHNNIL